MLLVFILSLKLLLSVNLLSSGEIIPISQRAIARNAASSLVGCAASLCLIINPARGVAERDQSSFNNLENAADFITKNCQTILKSTSNTGRCLYRGELNLGKQASLENPNGDLLSKSTYSSSSAAVGVAAADYFKFLDGVLLNGSLVKYGHICTSSQRDASAWGPVYSIWPLDQGLHYMSFLKYRSLWDDEWSTPQTRQSEGAFFWRNPETLSRFLDKNCRIDTGLESALASEHEILFCNDGGYVAVPISQESKLLRHLNIDAFSPEVIPTRSQAMDVDEIRRSSKDRFIVY